MSGIIGGAGSKSGVIGTTELDYEEGTWTPTWVTADTPPSIRIGFYTRIGNHITCRFEITTAADIGTGYLYMGGLPFPIANTTGAGSSASVSGHFGCRDLGGIGTSYTHANIRLWGTTKLEVGLLGTDNIGGTWEWWLKGNVDDSSSIWGHLNYRIEV